jgi:4-diphosphocytidyl-2-C-methyl-D-erythritol kinase
VLRHFNSPQYAVQIGADVPVCLSTAAQRMQGIGDVLTALPNMPSCAAVLVNPGVHVPTPQIFKALVQKTNPPMPDVLPSLETAQDLIAWLSLMRNDMQGPACALTPVINDVLAALAALSPFTRMSGSGATCFALFNTRKDADDAAQKLFQAHPTWWVQPVTLS